MDIHYYKQERVWTCGAAAMRMALESLGIKKTEKQLIRLLRTNKKTGTPNKSIPDLAEKYRLNYIVQRKSNVSDLKRLQKQGYVIIVSYYYKPHETGHFAVIKNISNGKIHLLDPWAGPGHAYSFDTFKKIWRSGDYKERRWFVAIRRNN